MTFRNTILSIACAGALLPIAAFAQGAGTTTGSTSSPWSNLGASGPYIGFGVGRGKLHSSCPAGFNCDLRDQSWRVFGGASFNNILGGEVGVMDLGNWDRGGGTTSARGVDAKLTAGWPIGENARIFGKLGVAYLRTNVTGTGLTTGSDNKWGPTYGIGAQVGLGRNWAVRGDIDRYRAHLASGWENIDMYTIGAQCCRLPKQKARESGPLIWSGAPDYFSAFTSAWFPCT